MSGQPSGADTAAYAFGMFVLTIATALREIAALGIGVAGTLQRCPKKALALPGVACSVPFLMIHDQAGLGRLVTMAVAFITEPTPKVHTVQP